MVMSRSTRAVKRPQASSASICDGKRLGRRARLGKREIERLQRNAIDRRRLARDAVVVHRVDAVGGDVHLVERAVAGAEIVDAFDGDAAQGQVFGELRVVDGKLGQITAKPFGKNLHANCPRNRISPAKKLPISLMPYFIMAMRSTPMPKAKPEIFFGS